MSHTATPFVSVIIPVLNDADALCRLLGALEQTEAVEVVVVDGASRSAAMQQLQQRFPACRWMRSLAGRGIQMNTGARVAGGTWLLFLHADTRLPGNWIAEVQSADAAAGTVWGCFSFSLDSRDWRARLLERAVSARVRYCGLPYGDQALFVRRDVFARIDGFAVIPLMEDVDLVRRLRHEGRGWFSGAKAVTSARRWEREGWLSRSARNMSLLLQYLAGVSPAVLARKYDARAPTGSRAAIVVMARAPSDALGKTRLVGGLAEERATDLRRALLLDTLAGLGDISDVGDIVIQYAPSEAREEFERIGRDLILVPQAKGDLGARMHHVARQVLDAACDAVIIVGSDVPTINGSTVRQAIDTLRSHTADVVLGPSEDGGYYLIGLRRAEAGLFSSIEWSTPSVLRQTITASVRRADAPRAGGRGR
jgi:rSAM/selenodomain-associated transferase 2/rSAM/selenodomain-associated transferase 1